MSKRIQGILAFVTLCGISLLLINCGSSTSRPAGVLYVLSQGASNVGSYAIDLGNGNLSLINSNAKTDTTPSTIILDPSGAVAFVLNAGSNTITAYTVNKDGSLTAGSGSTPILVENSVGMARDDAGKLLFVVSQGTIPPPPDCGTPTDGCPGISVFTMQSGSTTLSPVAGSPFLLGRVPTSVIPSITVTVPDPSNPAANLSGPLLYVANNQDLIGTNDNTVTEFIFDTASNTVMEMPGSPYTTGSDPSAVLALKTTPAGGSGGLFVYIANGGNGSGGNALSVFQVCLVQNATCTAQDVADAKMIPVGSPVSVGTNPVAMTADPTNNFLYVASNSSNQVSGFRINQTTGALTALNPATMGTGLNPIALAMQSSGKFLYVSNNGSSSISGYNVDTTSGAMSSPITITSSAQPAGLVAK